MSGEGAAAPGDDGARKAAALLIAMGRPLAQRMVTRLEAGELRKIAATARSMPPMNRAVMDALVEDFARHFVDQVGAGPAASEIGAILAGGLGEDAAGRLDAPAEEARPESHWPAIAALAPARLKAALEPESAEVTAAIFSALPPHCVAAVLSLMDDARRAAVTALMLVAPAPRAPVLRALETGLWSLLSAEDVSARAVANRKRVAAILNALPRAEADAVLGRLRAEDAAEADAVAALMFDFGDIVTLDAAARTLLMDAQPVDRVIAALHGAGDALREAVLSALGARARRMADAELASGNAPPAAVTQAARRAIADAALQLAEDGRITLAPVKSDV